MSEADPKRGRSPFSGTVPLRITPVHSSLTRPPATDAPTVCDRCGAEMYRMHAVWRCPSCGFKTDCCGW